MKIIQIATTEGGTDNSYDNLYALTDSGELFMLPNSNNNQNNAGKWVRISEPPQITKANES